MVFYQELIIVGSLLLTLDLALATQHSMTIIRPVIPLWALQTQHTCLLCDVFFFLCWQSTVVNIIIMRDGDISEMCVKVVLPTSPLNKRTACWLWRSHLHAHNTQTRTCTHRVTFIIIVFLFCFVPMYRQLVLALEAEQNQLKSIRNKIQEVNWQRKQEQVSKPITIVL